MNIEHARRMIAAHERAAERNPAKRYQHLKAAEQYRKEFNIPEPVNFGRPTSEPNRQFQRAEAARIRKFKETGAIDPCK